MQLTTLHVVPRLRMHGAMPLLPYMFSGCEVQLRMGTALLFMVQWAFNSLVALAHLRNRKVYNE